MKRFLALLLGCVGSLALAQTVVTVPSQTVTLKIPAQSITVTIPAQTVTVPNTVPVTPPVVTPPVVTPPVVTPAGTSWVFHNGLVWINHDMSYGDYNYNYTDTTGKPDVGTLDVSAVGTQGGWQPGSPNLDWDTTGYNSLVISIKPGAAGMTFIMGAESSASGGDTVIAGGLNPDVGSHCDTPLTAGVWSHCTIPLHGSAGFNLPVGQHLRKIMLQAQSPAGKKSFFLEEVGFIP